MAKLDHMIFKSNAYSAAFIGKSDDSLGDHTQCRFGKWYVGDGKKEFGENQAFNEINTPHKLVHDNILKAMKLLKDSELVHSDEIIESFKKAEKASAELFKHLDDMVE